MRTGKLWGITKHGIEPDILVTGKGLSGGMYPISAVLVASARRLADRGRLRPHVDVRWRRGGLHRGDEDAGDLQPARDPLDGALRRGPLGAGRARSRPTSPTGSSASGRRLVMGLEFDHPQGREVRDAALYENGVWAIFSTLDPTVLQFKPGMLLDARRLCEEAASTARPSPSAPRLGRGPRPRPAPDLGDEHPVVRQARRRRAPGGRWSRARKQMLERARWAARSFASPSTGPRPSGSSTPSPPVGKRDAEKYAEWAVRETGFGVVADKVVKNQAVLARGCVDALPRRGLRHAPDRRARRRSSRSPAGRRRPRADPVHQPGLDGLLQGPPRPDDPQRGRGQPAPMRQGVCAEAARMLGEAAGQPVPRPAWCRSSRSHRSRFVEALMTDERTGVSSRPAGTRSCARRTPPATLPRRRPRQRARAGRRDRRPARRRRTDGGQQGVRQLGPVHQRERARGRGAVADGFPRDTRARRATCSSDAERDQVRDTCSPVAASTPSIVGRPPPGSPRRRRPGTSTHPDPGRAVRPASWRGAARAREAAPRCWVVRGAHAQRGIRRPAPCCASAVPATRRRSTATTRGPDRVRAAVPVLRVTVNAGGSPGSAGIDTHLAPSMTIGTGFVGR